MKTIKFSENWNKKLHGNYFTTIRRKSSEFEIGVVIQFELNNSKHVKFKGQIVEIYNYKFDEIPMIIKYLDTGYGLKECEELFKRFYGNDLYTLDFSVLLIKRVSDFEIYN